VKKLAIVSAILLFSACEKEKIVLIEKPVSNSWKPVANLNFESKIVFNAFSNDQAIYFLGSEYLTSLDKKKKITNAIIMNSFSGRKTPINSDIFISGLFQNYLQIRLTRAPVSNDGAIAVDLKNFDSTYTGVNSNLRKLIMEINDRNECLIPYFTTNSDKQTNLLLIKLKKNEEDGGSYVKYTVDNFKILTINEPTNLAGWTISFIKWVGNFFLVSKGGSTYKILSDGTITKTLPYGTSEAFRLGSNIHALNEDGIIAKSSDGGNTWEVGQGTPQTLAIGTHYPIGDSLVFTNWDFIATVKYTSKSYTIRPLKDDGLVGNRITSVNLFNDSIYVSTTTGVYYKSKKEFFDSKPQTK
jgi:hypothetical protein